MVFFFSIEFERRIYRLSAERVFIDKVHEEYRIHSKSSYFTLQSNRPNLRNRGLRHMKPRWSVVEGKEPISGILERVIKEVMKVVDK